MILVCEICDEKLATFDPDAVTVPIDGWMFQPLDHGYPHLWPEGMGWEHMRCPHCRYRPVVDEGRLLTTDGYHEIGAEVDEPIPEPEPQDRLALIAMKAKEKQRGKRNHRR
jgi:hypothetical protein